ncbi:M48 family metalloprotease [Horticoccus sp. 23ND18S-11]|uniref:M48 family metalloprotease n=1 Tax=Horticoccus sp. 23ND18S-11 TaxID=3391832 RepID=UPI0039C983B0
MSARRILPAGFAVALAFGSLASIAHAQFGGLDKLRQGIDKAKSTTQSVTDTSRKVADTAKDASKVAKGVMGIGPEEEKLIGESVALEIIGKYGGLVRDDAIVKRVNLLGQALAYYSTRPALPWTFAVLDSASVNGFSAPGGYVFITRGLYDAVAGSDDALAAILAHEIAHITERHALKIIARAEFVAGTTTLAVKNNATAAQVQSQLSQFDTGIADLLKTLLEKGFDPKTELAADKTGRALAVTVGYAPGALRQVLVQLQQKKSDPNATFSTHPPLADRIKNLPNDPAPASQ